MSWRKQTTNGGFFQSLCVLWTLKTLRRLEIYFEVQVPCDEQGSLRHIKRGVQYPVRYGARSSSGRVYLPTHSFGFKLDLLPGILTYLSHLTCLPSCVNKQDFLFRALGTPQRHIWFASWGCFEHLMELCHAVSDLNILGITVTSGNAWRCQAFLKHDVIGEYRSVAAFNFSEHFIKFVWESDSLNCCCLYVWAMCSLPLKRAYEMSFLHLISKEWKGNLRIYFLDRVVYSQHCCPLQCHDTLVRSPLVLIPGVFSFLCADEAEEEDQWRSVGGCECARHRGCVVS